jgi:hypothetical protein
MADKPSRAHVLDHIVVVLFENRSLETCSVVSTGQMTRRHLR